MGDLASEVTSQLQTETAFTIPIFGGIDVSESVVVTWIVMALLIILAVILTRKLKVKDISRRQAAAELIVTKLEGLVSGIVGENGTAYIPYLVSVLLYIAIANLIGIFGLKPPTKDINVTATMAIMSIVLVQIAMVRRRGLGKWGKSFLNPINILDLVTRPLSLCMRLFGNVLGAFVIMEILKAVVPVVLPSVFSLYFDFFDGILQAYVFVFLTSIYIKEAVE